MEEKQKNEFYDATETPETLVRKTKTTAALSCLAVTAYIGEHKGRMHSWDPTLRAVGESAAHPVLGYIGAWVGLNFSKKIGNEHKAGLAVGVATVANFATETAQSIVSVQSQYTDFLAGPNLPETAKDYVFALLGAGLYMAQNRDINISQEGED